MRYKKPVHIFIILSILTISFLPVLNTIVSVRQGNYILNFDKRYLFNTDIFESYRNYFTYKIFKISFEENKVIIGKNDFFFLGNSYAQVLDKVTGKFRPDKIKIDEWTAKLHNLQKWYEGQGISFLYVIAPNSHTIYQEYLPDNLIYSGNTITDDIVESANKKGINILDLRPVLLKHKIDNKLLYHKTDTHWNEYGASIAYDATIDKLNEIYSINLRKPIYSLNRTLEGGGDLTDFLKITNLIEVNNESFILKPHNDKEICIGDIDLKSGHLNKCNIEMNRNMQINAKPQYIMNWNALNNQKLLWLCDSFGTANSKLYNLSFNQIFKLHNNEHLLGNNLTQFINENKPDIVIYQIVERAIYDEQIFKVNNEITKIKDRNYGNNSQVVFDLATSSTYVKNEFVSLNLLKNKIELNVDKDDTGIILLTPLNSAVSSKYLYVDMDSPIDTIFQIYYKKTINDEYSEDDSYKVKIKKGNNKFTLKMNDHLIDHSLRIDIVKHAGIYQINSMKIYSE